MRLSHLTVALGIVTLLLGVPSGGECEESWEVMISPVSTDLNALWGISDFDIFSAGDNGVILHFTGTGLTWTEMTSGTLNNLYGLWGSSSDNVFAAGVGILLRNTGGAWSAVNELVKTINALWGSSGTDIFAVGSSGLILQSDNGIDWVSVNDNPTAINIYSIWGSASDNIYIGGEIGNIFRYNGQTWQKVANGLSNQTIRALWGSSASDIFAAGDSGVILHYDGAAWAPLVSGTGLDLYCLWGSSGDDVFAAGENGIILTYNSSTRTWSTVTPGVPIGIDLRGIWGSTAGYVYLAGTDGTIIRYRRDDHIPPVVVSTSYDKLNSGKAYISTNVAFHFSEEMDVTTITDATITLKTGSVTIPGTVTSDDITATFNPNGDLAYSTTYSATVTTGVKDAATDPGPENAMKENYTFSFTTEDKPGSEGSGSSGGCFISSARM